MKYEGTAERIEQWIIDHGLGILLVSILFTFLIIGALVALVIYLV